MRTCAFVPLLACVAASVGCASVETAGMPPGPFDQVVLLDVHGLWGGRDLWIPSDGRATCCAVEPPKEGQSGLQETRYAFHISESEVDALNDLIAQHHFFTIKTRERDGLPDEARPILLVKTGERRYGVSKWANEKHRDFDAIYDHLIRVAERGRQGTPIASGPYDWSWHPEGFPENRTVRTLAIGCIRER